MRQSTPLARHVIAATALTAATLTLTTAPAAAALTVTPASTSPPAPAPGTLTRAPALSSVTVAPAETATPPAVPRAPGAGALALPPPSCPAAPDDAFPLDTLIHDGPDRYRAGDGPLRWRIELANATGAECAGVHPVVVLVDTTRALRGPQVRMEFRDGTRWRPAAIERTDRDETIAVFDDGFAGFAVPAHGSVNVDVRLAFAADATPNEVVAQAAVVQRRSDDGAWVGESEPYRFRVDAASKAVLDGRARPAVPAAPSPGARPSAPYQLATTGAPSRKGLAAAAVALFLTGTALFTVARRFRTPGPHRH
ncbi:hypothetical protein ACIQNU_00860 [Streptomyces sp. NPDC091292]|uniref:hypothetical protein n=1 Tax=Streptomyces sp. NPDC091292 TaxID=3365991 RepID=UPI003817BE04